VTGDLVVRLQAIELYVVALAWLLFVLVFVLRRRPPRTRERVRDPRSTAGIVLQAMAFTIVGLGRRSFGADFLHLGSVGELGVAVVAFAFLAGSLVMVRAAVSTLGKQWSLVARLVQSHELVTTGPYHLVRHPLYTGIFGMLLGTALAISQWPALLAASAVFLVGTLMRMRAEEELRVAAFGDSYRVYARAVPALLPGWPCA
jgi:protein-S-isoprenylcysteine O-methyltransferase Ste14